MIKIWGRSNAYNVQKVLWFLEEIAIDYEHCDIGSVPGDLDSEEFQTMNLHGRIPVLKDDELYVWESNTILRYLASEYGREAFWSGSSSSRTYYERWMDWELATLQPDFISLFWEYYRTPNQQRNIDKIDYFSKRCQKNMGILNEHLKENLYLAGSIFSIGDVAVGTSFYRYYNMGLKVPEFEYVDSWYKRLCERASYKKIIAVSFEELKGRLEF